MVRPVESIRKDLNALEGSTATLAAEFSQIYASYLTVLGHATRRQMIMATYHLCTQVYPEAFLVLPVSDRARVQQGIQTLGHKAQGWLQELLEPDLSPPEVDLTQRLAPEDLNRLEAALATLTDPSGSGEVRLEISMDGYEAAVNLPSGDENGPDGPDEPDADEADANVLSTDAIAAETVSEDSADSPPSLRESSLSDDEDKAPDQDIKTAEASGIDPKKLVQSVIMAAMANEVDETFSDPPFTGDPLTPTLVAKHHLILEQLIRAVLERASKKANNLLRKAQVIPDLPESVVEVASDADGVALRRSVPNVLNVLVAMAGDVALEFDPSEQDDDGADAEPSEDEDDDDAVEGTMTHLAAIHLRLADIEFTDVQAALWRSKLRTAVGRLRKLGKQYQQAERELAIAQAEQAWRSVWHDDSSR